MRSLKMLTSATALAVVTLGSGACGRAAPPPPAACLPPPPDSKEDADAKAVHVPPDYDAVPDGPLGDAVRRGALIFGDTPTHAGDYVGNAHSCVNCHLDLGRRPNSGPLWAAWGMYPDYREKDNRVDTMEDRIRGCFTYSMNAQGSKSGHAPPPGDPILVDLQAYMRWLATKAPTGSELPGRGFPVPPKPEGGPSIDAGAAVYASKCALCHGDDGQGRDREDDHMQFPPLWGAHAFNWGAGMHRVNTAAGFIKANMPLGQGNSLSDKEAWDVAAFINSHERPRDPRQVGTVAEADAAFHKHDCMYGEGVGDGTATSGKGDAGAAIPQK